MFWLCEEVKEGHQLNLRKGGDRRYASLRLQRNGSSPCLIHFAKRWFGIAAEISNGQNGTQISIPLASRSSFFWNCSAKLRNLHMNAWCFMQMNCPARFKARLCMKRFALCRRRSGRCCSRILGGFGDEEIARRLSVTPRTVYNLRQRAFKVVKAFYEQKRAPP